jgi:hypothetical protein
VAESRDAGLIPALALMGKQDLLRWDWWVPRSNEEAGKWGVVGLIIGIGDRIWTGFAGAWEGEGGE